MKISELIDDTENARRVRISEVNTGLDPEKEARRAELEAAYGKIWNHFREKTHCPHGHPYSGSNLIIGKDGARRCRICRKEQGK